MTDTFSNKQIKQIQQVLSNVIDVKLDAKLDERLGENFLQRIKNIEENVDKIAKAVADDRDELDIVKGRVSGLDVRVTKLESACTS